GGGGGVGGGGGGGGGAGEGAMLGAPFGGGGPMTDEYLRARGELWTSPSPSFAGKYVQFSALHFEPEPVQKPHPPIWVGGHSKAALRRTVELGAAWHPINRSPAELRAGVAELARLSRDRGRATPPALTLRNDGRILRSGGGSP